MARILLVDFSAVFHRAWHASKDQVVGFAFESTIKKIRWLASSGYDGAAVCIDSPPYSRKQLSPEYKANREQPDPAFLDQMRRARERLAHDGFPIWGVQGFEADDIIASACAWGVLNKHKVHIASADKDLLSLVTDSEDGSGGVYFRNTASPTDEIYDEAKVLEKFGVKPSEMPCWLALVGDTSDNVQGVRGVGPKKAAELIKKYESVDQLRLAL